MVLALVAACTTPDPVAWKDTADTDTDTDTDTDALTLDTCGGTVDTDVPEPYRSWFRCADLASDGTTLSVHSGSLPPHPSPYYDTTSPNWVAFDDRGGDWHQNPNVIATQELLLSIPLNPTPKGITVTADMVDESAGTNAEEYRGNFQGVGLDGTALFTGVAAPGDDISDEEYTFDLYEGHPTDQGTYHHHGTNPAALAVTTWLGLDGMELYGVMCDGTLVLGCTELDGADPGNLDAQNGHEADIEYPSGTVLFDNRYHVHACATLGRTLTPEIQFYEGECG